jgi:hypothetical protein
MVFGMVLVVVVIFGTLFWGDLMVNQRELANTPLPPAPTMSQGNPQGSEPALSESDDYDSIESDLNATDVDNVDSGSGELEAEINAL